jgi:hypothetical protein
VLLLVIAITIHNFPEGMAVGVGFGGTCYNLVSHFFVCAGFYIFVWVAASAITGVGKSPGATFQNARSLAFGIGGAYSVVMPLS